MSKKEEAICENCSKKFYATFDQLDHTGFVTSSTIKNKQTLRIYNFCSYKCEKEFIEKMKAIDPEMVNGWTEADQEDKKKYPEYYIKR